MPDFLPFIWLRSVLWDVLFMLWRTDKVYVQTWLSAGEWQSRVGQPWHVCLLHLSQQTCSVSLKWFCKLRFLVYFYNNYRCTENNNWLSYRSNCESKDLKIQEFLKDNFNNLNLNPGTQSCCAATTKRTISCWNKKPGEKLWNGGTVVEVAAQQ